jgi:arylsulfatase A-like enzyme
MNRLAFALILLVATLTSPATLSAQQNAPARPNIILIMTDDAGYGDFGSYGAPDARTPNIDSIARDGIRLTDFYAMPSCSPTRAALISGRYPQRFQIERPLGGTADAERGLPVTGRSLPQLLKNNGYTTALVGKWHLGYLSQFSPIAHGFDYFFGFKSGFIDYHQHTPAADSPLESDLWENDSQVKVPGYMTDLISERSMRWIEQNAGRPFFVDVAFNAPHWPYQDPDVPSVAPGRARHVSPFDSPTNSRADYVKMIERVDRGVGQILQLLDRLGLRQNTIVIFTNDNGGEWLSSNAPLFHNKGSVWEGGIRVPAMIRWPERIAPGTVSEQAGITMDLTASILAVTGSPVPADARLDGIDLFPILEGRARQLERTLFWRVGAQTGAAARGGGANAAGARTDAPAARGPAATGQQAVRFGDWKLVMDGSRAALFNLRTDIGERTNLIGQRSDVARRLRPLLNAWQAEVSAEGQRNASR